MLNNQVSPLSDFIEFKSECKFLGKLIDNKLNFSGHINLVINKLLLLFDNNKIEMARKPGKKQKENLVGHTGEGRR